MSTFRRALLTIIMLGLAGGAVRLGFWQLSRLGERRASNAVLLAGQAAPPIDLSEVPVLGLATSLEGRRVVAVGSFVAGADLLLRGRVNNKAPGLEVMTPFALAGGGTLWVLRGFVPSPDATTPPATYSPGDSGQVILRGLMLAIPSTSDGGQPLERDGRTTFRRLDRDLAATRFPDSPPYYLLLDPDVTARGDLASVPLPPMNDGPHLSYAIQWFGIALAVLAFGFIALRPADPARVPPRRAP